MAVARKSDVSASGWFGVTRRRNRRAKERKPTTEQRTLTRSPSRSASSSASTSVSSTDSVQSQRKRQQRVPIVPASDATPEWLLRLYVIHRYSSITVFLLVAATLVVYGWTVYSQQLWSQASRELQNLQRHERQLTTKNEVLKNQMAQEAEQPSTKLVLPSPSRMIFINPAPVNPNPIQSTEVSKQIPQPSVNPLAY